MEFDAVLQECRERQEDEIVALESIFAPPEGDDSKNQDETLRSSHPRVHVIRKDSEPIIEPN